MLAQSGFKDIYSYLVQKSISLFLFRNNRERLYNPKFKCPNYGNKTLLHKILLSAFTWPYTFFVVALVHDLQFSAISVKQGVAIQQTGVVMAMPLQCWVITLIRL